MGIKNRVLELELEYRKQYQRTFIVIRLCISAFKIVVREVHKREKRKFKNNFYFLSLTWD